jgi:hypothetical protein
MFHDARDVGYEVVVIAGAAQEVEAHLNAAAGGDDAPGVDDAGAADAALRGDLSDAVDRHLEDIVLAVDALCSGLRRTD